MTEREMLRGPLSESARFRLLVTGPVGGFELHRLVELIQAERARLSEADGGDGVVQFISEEDN